MPDSKCIVHIGLGKTGSSYIQSALDHLSQRGELVNTCYPPVHQFEDFLTVRSGNGVELAHLLNPALTPNWQRRDVHPPLSRLLKQHTDRKQTLLISSEMFSNSNSERFSTFCEVLEDKGYAVTVLACIREIREWIFSTYQQGVKRAALSESFDEFSETKLSEYTYATATRLRNMGDRLQVFPYHRNDLFHRFLREVGEDPKLAAAVPRKTVNRSLSREELNVLLQVNGVFNSSSLSETLSDSFLYKAPGVVSARPSEREFAMIERLLPEARERIGKADSKPLEEALDLLFSDPCENQRRVEGENEQETENMALGHVLEHLKEACEEWTLIRGYVQGLERAKGPFDPVHYALMYPNVLRKQQDLKSHFEESGKAEGRMGRLGSPKS